MDHGEKWSRQELTTTTSLCKEMSDDYAYWTSSFKNVIKSRSKSALEGLCRLCRVALAAVQLSMLPSSCNVLLLLLHVLDLVDYFSFILEPLHGDRWLNLT